MPQSIFNQALFSWEILIFPSIWKAVGMNTAQEWNIYLQVSWWWQRQASVRSRPASSTKQVPGELGLPPQRNPVFKNKQTKNPHCLLWTKCWVQFPSWLHPQNPCLQIGMWPAFFLSSHSLLPPQFAYQASFTLSFFVFFFLSPSLSCSVSLFCVSLNRSGWPQTYRQPSCFYLLSADIKPQHPAFYYIVCGAGEYACVCAFHLVRGWCLRLMWSLFLIKVFYLSLESLNKPCHLLAVQQASGIPLTPSWVRVKHWAWLSCGDWGSEHNPTYLVHQRLSNVQLWPTKTHNYESHAFIYTLYEHWIIHL